MTNHLIILVLLTLLKLTYADYRTINGTYNNLKNPLSGSISSTLSRLNPPISYYNDADLKTMISTPGNYTSVPKDYATCSASNDLPDDIYPLPRCTSDLIGSMNSN